MTGTKAGTRLAVAKILARNPHHYREIGRMGGKAKRTKPSGFAAMPREKVQEAGRKGGAMSRRRSRQAEL